MVEVVGAVVVDVDVDEDEDDEVDVDSEVSVTPKLVAEAPGDDKPNRNTPTITATTPAQSAANEARRGAETRDTPSTLDRRPQRFSALRTSTWPGSTAESALMKRTGIGRATTDRPAQ